MVLCHTNRSIQRLIAILLVSFLAWAAAPVVAEETDAETRRPYLVEHEQTGMIGCSVAYKMIMGKDFCGDMNANAQSRFGFPLDARLTTLVLQVNDQGGRINADEFSVSLLHGMIPTVRGPLPLLATYTFDEENSWTNWGEDGQTLDVDIRLNHDASTPQISYEQKIQVCLGLFYNDEPVPDGYVPCPDL